jgi:hypothetical protein
MAEETVVYYRFLLRSYSKAYFAATNDILKEREIGRELDTGRCKVGDGSTPWNDLGYTALGLGDIDLSTLNDGDTLIWNAAANAWQSGPAGLDTAALFARISLRV